MYVHMLHIRIGVSVMYSLHVSSMNTMHMYMYMYVTLTCTCTCIYIHANPPSQFSRLGIQMSHVDLSF